MSPQGRKLLELLIGADPKMRRMLAYWGATGVLYVFCMVLLWLQVHAGTTTYDAGVVLTALGGVGIFSFYGLVRAGPTLGIEPWVLAFFQAMFAILCTVAAYSVIGPIRGAALVILPVVIVFCAFSLRPLQARILAGFAIVMLGLAMLWMTRSLPQQYPLIVELMHFALASCSLIAVTILTGELSRLRTRLRQQKDELTAALATIRTLATVDELTSLANRRHMHAVLNEEERRQLTLGQPICLALLDIDFFKRVNDQYGHAGGDDVLRAFSAQARSELRGDDTLARWGGEEFLLLLPDTELAEAMVVLRRIAERVGAMRLPALDPALQITFSGGVVACQAREPFAEAIRRADEAMYRAKSKGRNCIVTS